MISSPSSAITMTSEQEEDVLICQVKSFIDKYMIPVIQQSGESLPEGNIMMHHCTLDYNDSEYGVKQRRLIQCARQHYIHSALEIGFNTGFSALLLLMSNPLLKLTCVDIGDHKYVKPCYEVLKQHFGNRIELILGDSMKILPILVSENRYFQLFHIDGSHIEDVAESDIVNCMKMTMGEGNIIVFDDTELPHLQKLWIKYIFVYDLKRPNFVEKYYQSPRDLGNSDVRFFATKTW